MHDPPRVRISCRQEFHPLACRSRTSRYAFERDESFQFEPFFEDSWNVFHGDLQTVRLRVKGIAARLVEERSSPKQMEIDWIASDEALVTATISGEQEIINWVLSMGTNAELLEPEWLRERVRQILSGALGFYVGE